MPYEEFSHVYCICMQHDFVLQMPCYPHGKQHFRITIYSPTDCTEDLLRVQYFFNKSMLRENEGKERSFVAFIKIERKYLILGPHLATHSKEPFVIQR